MKEYRSQVNLSSVVQMDGTRLVRERALGRWGRCRYATIGLKVGSSTTIDVSWLGRGMARPRITVEEVRRPRPSCLPPSSIAAACARDMSTLAMPGGP
jgi:hypothetical protein